MTTTPTLSSESWTDCFNDLEPSYARSQRGRIDSDSESDSELDLDVQVDGEADTNIPGPRYPFNERNVFVRDATTRVVAGMYQPGHYTITTVYRWLRMLFEREGQHWFLRAESGGERLHSSDDSVLAPGSYVVVNDCKNPTFCISLELSNLTWQLRRRSSLRATFCSEVYQEILHRCIKNTS